MRALRARRAAGIEAAEPGRVRNPDELLVPAVESSLEALNLDGRDAGAAALARLYASAIDGARNEAAALKVLAPGFLKVLTALGATPSSGRRPLPAQEPSGRLAELRRNSRAPGRRAAADPLEALRRARRT